MKGEGREGSEAAAHRESDGGEESGWAVGAQETFFRTFNNERRKQREKNKMAWFLYDHCSPARKGGTAEENEDKTKETKEWG